MFGLPIRDTQEDFGWGIPIDMISTAPKVIASMNYPCGTFRGPCGAWRPSGTTIEQIID